MVDIPDRFTSRTITAFTAAAHAFRVTHDMTAMVEWTAAQLGETDEFARDLAPTGCGIVGFDRPIPIHDARGKVMLCHWLVWGPAPLAHASNPADNHAAVLAFMFNDVWRQPDEVHHALIAGAGGGDAERLARMVGRWAPVGVHVDYDGQRMGPALVMPSEKHAAEILAEGDTPTPGTNSTRILHALWLLLDQTVTTVEDDPVDRPARRRAGKASLPAKVTVIRLRRESNSLGREPGESQVQWSHRWIVRQHWRWQPYGPRLAADHPHTYGVTEVDGGALVQRCTYRGCENYLRRIIIAASVKGPEGAPLVQSEKVYDLSR